MPSQKRLNSICRSIAHHAVSGISYIHPHMLQACRAAGQPHMTVSLLESEPCPESFRGIEPLRLSLRALRKRFEEILAAEGFSVADLAEASLTFSPDPQFSDDYCTVCHSRLTSHTGRSYEHTIDCLGQPRHADYPPTPTPK
jgi:hypothetical protein